MSLPQSTFIAIVISTVDSHKKSVSPVPGAGMSRLIVMSKLCAENRSSDWEGFPSGGWGAAPANGICESLSISDT